MTVSDWISPENLVSHRSWQRASKVARMSYSIILALLNLLFQISIRTVDMKVTKESWSSSWMLRSYNLRRAAGVTSWSWPCTTQVGTGRNHCCRSRRGVHAGVSLWLHPGSESKEQKILGQAAAFSLWSLQIAKC